MKTRDGTLFRIYATDGKAPHSIHGAIFVDGSWLMYEWTADGYVNTDGVVDGLDLHHDGNFPPIPGVNCGIGVN